MSCECVNKSRKSYVRRPVIAGNSIGECAECVVSHLTNARNIIKDAVKGRVDRYRVVWHLASAANKAPKNNRVLSQALLDARRNYQRDGVIPDWDWLIHLSRQGINATN